MPAAKKSPLDHLQLRTIESIAGLCQVSTRTVRRWIDHGELVAYRLGRQLRVSERDLELFLRERRGP